MRTPYDVIVVGTGAGGSTAIKALCEAGLNVLALNSGRKFDQSGDATDHIRSFELPYRGHGDPKTRSAWVGCETEKTTGRDIWEHDIGYTVAPGTEWVWSRCKATGGKANFWGRSSARFAQMDFQESLSDGQGVEWPVTYAEIAPYYSRIERYIGVASTRQNRASNPDGEYIDPIPFRRHDHILSRAAAELGIPYLPDRIAQLTRAHNNRAPCHYCGNCTSGCGTGSFFSPTWYTLPDAEKTGHYELRVDAHVRAVLTDTAGARVTGVSYIDRATRQEREVHAKVVILAASCCETAKILLNSKSKHWPTGLANSSGQVGRNLSDHLYGTAATGYLPQLLDRPSEPDNVHNATVVWMPRWQNLESRDHPTFSRGYSVYVYGGCEEFPSYHRRLEGFGSAFKKDMRRFYGAPVSFLVQAPSLPSSDNFLDIDPHRHDPFGIPLARFHFKWGANELAMWEHAKHTCADIIRTAGGVAWGTGDKPDPPGSSLHETGMCRFGKDPQTSVTNSFAQTHDISNLFICDASIFPYSTDKTTTLSIMAFALRTSSYIVDRFRTRSI